MTTSNKQKVLILFLKRIVRQSAVISIAAFMACCWCSAVGRLVFLYTTPLHFKNIKRGWDSVAYIKMYLLRTLPLWCTFIMFKTKNFVETSLLESAPTHWAGLLVTIRLEFPVYQTHCLRPCSEARQCNQLLKLPPNSTDRLRPYHTILGLAPRLHFISLHRYSAWCRLCN